MSIVGLRLGLVVLGVVFVLAGAGIIFAGFEFAAYQETIADREVTTEGTVSDKEVYQLPDGNWTYSFDYEYTFDQEAELTDQGLVDVYLDAAATEQPAVERPYRRTKDGGKDDTESEARSSMRDNFDDDGTVTVYVDPFFPAEGSLSDATDFVPRALQYAGSVLTLVGLVLLARRARRVST